LKKEEKEKQNGKLCVIKNGSGVPCYYFRWWEFPPQPAAPVRRKREVGRVDSMTLEQAEAIVMPWIAAANAHRPGPHSVKTMGELIAHFRRTEMPSLSEADLAREFLETDVEDDEEDDGDENDRAWSTQDRYDSVLKARIEPYWSKKTLDSIVAGEVEKWLRKLRCLPRKRKHPEKEKGHRKPLAAGSRAKIRNVMSLLFNHAIRWGIFPTNPISGPLRKSGVRQSSKRKKAPDILTVPEMRSILAELSIRERALISLDMITGLRRSELAGLRWEDIDFKNLIVNVVRSVVDQQTGKCKTEASAKPVPIDEYTAEDLLAWYRVTPYHQPGDWVFATDSARSGKKRGKQPLWLAKIMQYHIQPLVKRLGISKHVGWHTFRRTFTSLLTANKENVKVVQELVRHASVKTTLDTYAQAEMTDKRRAQKRIANRLHKPEKKGRPRRPLSRGGEHRGRQASRA
jgi:integrase